MHYLKSFIRVSVLSTLTMVVFIGSQPVLAAGSFPPTSGLVTHVFDGDTILVESQGKGYRVRILGIDTPEVDGPYTRKEPYGEKASARTKVLILGNQVFLEYDSRKHKDKHGRLLAYVSLPDGRDLGLLLISEGLAEAFHSTKYSRKKLYHKAQAKAEKARKGIWRVKRKKK